MKRLLLSAVALSALATGSFADVKLARLLSDGMVLQRNAPIKIWGKADPGERVEVKLGDTGKFAFADEAGEWQVVLPKRPAGGPFTLTATGKNSVTVKDVLIGEVWVASGQSNMEWVLFNAFEGQAEIAASEDSQLRMFTVQKTVAANLKDDVVGAWQSAGPATSGGFSAVGYYFAKKLRKELGVPVGVIHTSWGGTRIEAWTEKKTNLALGMTPKDYAVQDAGGEVSPARKAAYKRAVDAWKAAGSPTGAFSDPGRSPKTVGWEKPGADTSSWKTVTVPGTWEESGVEELASVDGAVWLRREFEASAAVAGSDATLHLGAIDDTDVTFVNGVLVGSLGPETPNVWEAKRVYRVPKGTLKPGKNVVAVRVWDAQGGGGMTGPADELYLNVPTVAAGVSQRITLGGTWSYQLERVRPSDPGPEPSGLDANSASVLYNGMLWPLRRYAIQGAIWYQGESNAGNPELYRKQLPAMVENWRRIFENPDASFYAVQLAPYMKINPEPEDTGWARLREAQRAAMASMKHTGMAVITDVGEENDIHPRRKGPVGERLALLALKDKYGKKNLAYQGPTVKSVSVGKSGSVVVRFANAFGGLVATPTDSAGRPVEAGNVVGFAVSGTDGKFVFASGKILGDDRVELTASVAGLPTAVRFGWANFPIVNLKNGAGIPAVPFEYPLKK